MLPRQYRLTQDRDFSHVYKHGRKYFSKHLSLYIVLSTKKKPRFAFVVSKKHAKLAVDRSRIRRTMRAIVQPIKTKIDRPVDVILSIKTSGALNFQELKDEVYSLFIKSGVIRNGG